MINTFFGTKIGPTRRFTQNGDQLPLTEVEVKPIRIVQVKTEKKDGYTAVQFGIDEKPLKRVKNPQKGHLKGADSDKAPLYLREIRLDDVSSFKPGDTILPGDVFKKGDFVNVTGVSKGKGFTGAMKRWGFAGGPRTHGQSDRPRSPGSIGQGTTPGRVFKGKKMPGRSGNQRTMIRNLQVLDLDAERGLLSIKGLVPGARGAFLEIQKTIKTKEISLLKADERIFENYRKKKEKEEK